MEPAIPRYDANALEARRQRAIEMLKDGKKKARVADELNVSRAAVTVWWHKYANNGDRGIARKARPGRPPKVQRDKIATLPILLKKGAVAYGYSTDLWTTKRVAELIRKEFVVSYDRDFVSRILNQLGLSWQRPERKAIERDEIAIKRRIQYRWPEKKASKLHATIVFADESGFSLVPFVAKTWAIRGRTPIIRHPFRWPKISSISAATTRNQLLFLVVDGTINAVVCQRFPIHLLRHVEGPIIVTWDNHQPHKSIEVLEIVKSSLGSLMIEYLPPYAPDLNPDEGVWSHPKTRELANSCAKDINQLRRDLRLAVVRTRCREGLVGGIVRGTSLCMAGLLT